MSGKPGSPRVLHILGTLAAGDPQAERCARIIDAFGARLRHSLVSADGRWSALESVARGVPVERLERFHALSGLPLPGRLQKVAQSMVDYHLVLTYGWGAVDAALAHTLFSQMHGLPPLIHHEDGSDETPRQRARIASTWYRRIGLGKTAGLVVPTELMEGEALVRWQQPLGRVKLIRDGAHVQDRRPGAKKDAIPRLLKRPGERWIGCIARMDGSEPVELLLKALEDVEPHWHLVVSGAGPGAATLATQAARRGLDARLHIVSELADPGVLIRLSDLVVVTGPAEPLPQAALAAMGAGKAVAGFETGELAVNLTPENAVLIARAGDESALRAAMHTLTMDDILRERIGAGNRARAVAERDPAAMIAAYRRLYASAMRRDTI